MKGRLGNFFVPKTFGPEIRSFLGV